VAFDSHFFLDDTVENLAYSILNLKFTLIAQMICKFQFLQFQYKIWLYIDIET